MTGRQRRQAVARGDAAGYGFTLVELMVVTALLGTLTGLLFPVLAGARERARRAACLTNLRQLGTAERLYMDDWDERFPHWARSDPPLETAGWYLFVAWPPRSGSSDNAQFWTDSYQPYLHSLRVLHDPSGPSPDLTVFGAPLADYALYTWGPGGRGVPSNPYWRWAGPSLTLFQVQRPADLVRLSDGSTTTLTVQADPGRHAGGVNACFLDGHAGWLARWEFLRVDTDGRGFAWLHYAAADQ